MNIHFSKEPEGPFFTLKQELLGVASQVMSPAKFSHLSEKTKWAVAKALSMVASNEGKSAKRLSQLHKSLENAQKENPKECQKLVDSIVKVVEKFHFIFTSSQLDQAIKKLQQFHSALLAKGYTEEGLWDQIYLIEQMRQTIDEICELADNDTLRQMPSLQTQSFDLPKIILFLDARSKQIEALKIPENPNFFVTQLHSIDSKSKDLFIEIQKDIEDLKTTFGTERVKLKETIKEKIDQQGKWVVELSEIIKVIDLIPSLQERNFGQKEIEATLKERSQLVDQLQKEFVKGFSTPISTEELDVVEFLADPDEETITNSELEELLFILRKLDEAI